MYYVYILLCSDNSLYTGITKDLDRRMEAHRDGDGSKYVFSRLPFKLIYSEKSGNRSEATKRELEIKGWPRVQKIKRLGLVLDS